MKSETAKRPKGQSYPLKSSKLEEVLASAGVSIDVYLIRSPGPLFDAFFWPPNPNVPYERLYVRAGSVPIEQAADARREIEATALPKLAQWIARILAADRKSSLRREQQVLVFWRRK
ncbi:hypothetical protein [Sphingomonas psychrotolerans]|uniref:Uncharacterized protein n=1 Tax=Sphingomonas psychrotolerans TaxID=1327635 RepID=A0A2K8MBL4_9SPHN|nr:hypothetical protein [Sphingomonas psychrotolerans]ATY31268.1 hypothetical protein CVN68_04145 [Sphingomonas psychrotolerans]